MLKTDLLAYLKLSNPLLGNPAQPIFAIQNYIQRVQTEQLLKPAWDKYTTLLTGPRQVGKNNPRAVFVPTAY